MSAVAAEVAQPIRIDLGAGKNPKDGFTGVDAIDFGNGSMICNIGKDRWPWDDSTVDEAHSSHTLEHLTNLDGRFERVHFFNELWRVLKPKAKCTLIVPHCFSVRYYGDPTHCEAFSEFAFYYLDRAWRLQNAPHTDIQFNPKGYNCDIGATWGYTLHPTLTTRNAEYVNHAQQFWLESRQDLHAQLEIRK